MKWWVWLIIFVLVVSGVFWLYVILTADKKKNEDMIASAANAREAKEEKRVQELREQAQQKAKKMGLKKEPQAGE